MLTALWTRKTDVGCKDSIRKAIETAKDEAMAAYIRKFGRLILKCERILHAGRYVCYSR
jgi:hypothetical protein